MIRLMSLRCLMSGDFSDASKKMKETLVFMVLFKMILRKKTTKILPVEDKKSSS